MRNSGKKSSGEDEVEQLLRAAQDDMLLKLNVDSHIARSSASAAIHPDLDRRFLALKKPRKVIKSDHDSVKEIHSKAVGTSSEDDLFTRFAALKGSVPSHKGKEEISNDQQMPEEDDDEDEVEKVIKWAIDAARLDPSPPSDDEDDDHNDDDSDDDGVVRGEKSNKK